MKTGLIKSTFEKNEVAKKCPSIILSAWCFNSRRAFYSPDHNPHSHVPVKMESRLAQALWDSRTCPSHLPHVTEVSQHTPTTTSMLLLTHSLTRYCKKTSSLDCEGHGVAHWRRCTERHYRTSSPAPSEPALGSDTCSLSS